MTNPQQPYVQPAVPAPTFDQPAQPLYHGEPPATGFPTQPAFPQPSAFPAPSTAVPSGPSSSSSRRRTSAAPTAPGRDRKGRFDWNPMVLVSFGLSLVALVTILGPVFAPEVGFWETIGVLGPIPGILAPIVAIVGLVIPKYSRLQSIIVLAIGVLAAGVTVYFTWLAA